MRFWRFWSCVSALGLLGLVLSGCAMEVRETTADAATAENTVENAPAKRVIVMQNPSLTPQDGGRLAALSSLQTGDILLAAGKGVSTYGVKVFTTSPVSHVALYVGNGEVIEAVGRGVRRITLAEMLEEESVIAAYRTADLQPDQAQRIVEFAEAQVGKKYNYVGVLLQAPFSLERRLCELPVFDAKMRDSCIRAVASIQLGGAKSGGVGQTFFCSQFLIEAYRSAGVPITDADPRWISPADIMHMREGDVPSVRINETLIYVGHLKYRTAAEQLKAEQQWAKQQTAEGKLP